MEDYFTSYQSLVLQESVETVCCSLQGPLTAAKSLGRPDREGTKHLLTLVKSHPLSVTCLYYYTAMSNEATARLMHSLAPSKIPLLYDARHSYQAAVAALPLPDELGAEDTFDIRSETLSSSSSASSSANSTPTPSRANSPLYPSSQSSEGSVEDSIEGGTTVMFTDPSTPSNKARRKSAWVFSPYSTILRTRSRQPSSAHYDLHHFVSTNLRWPL